METDSEEGSQARPARKSSFRAVLGERNFVLFWLGEWVSLLGDQFHMVALPWLVLQLTGDPLATGSVLAAAGVPRALFMLVGGALTDRLSARTVMLASNLARLVLVGGLAGLVLAAAVQLWMLYAFALLLGLASAFYFPAQSAIVPRLVAKDDLQAANSLVQGTAQLTVFLGPALAGALIALLGGGRHGPAALQGTGVAFAVDAATFLVSALTLFLIRSEAAVRPPEGGGEENVLAAIRTGLLAVWNDVPLRVFFLIIAAINFLFAGPFEVGVPVLANSRYPEGVIALGLIISAYGVGSLAGTVLGGVLPRPTPRSFIWFLLVPTAMSGLCLVVIGLAPSAIYGIGAGLAMGLTDGYIVIIFITWLQARTPAALLGRVMSLLMFAAVGLSPLSLVVAGALIRVDVTAVLVVSGAVLVLLVALAAASPQVRRAAESET